MDTLLHAVTPVAILWQFVRRLPVWAMAVLATLGAMPDLIGVAEKILYWDFSLWNWYNWAHQLGWWTWILLPWALHILMDAPLHGELSWWHWPWLLAEVVLWAALVYLLWRGFNREAMAEKEG